VVLIDPSGLFGGDRLRHCSNDAQLHWPRLFLASNGYGRLEINYHKLVARAYSTFTQPPSEVDLQGYIQEYVENFLLFLFIVDGQIWGAWDCPPHLLPRYKTAEDDRSPVPPEPAFSDWKRRYRQGNKPLPKCFGNVSVTFPRVVVGAVVEVGAEAEVKQLCATADADARVDAGDSRSSESRTENQRRASSPDRLSKEQQCWFDEFWSSYWLHKSKAVTRRVFSQLVKSQAKFEEIMRGLEAQQQEMLSREPRHRPHACTWLRQARWADETERDAPAQTERSIVADALARIEEGIK